jgi:hypothetical protein
VRRRVLQRPTSTIFPLIPSPMRADISSTTRRTVLKKHVLYSEISSVTSAMRKNSRWASTTHFMNQRDSALGSNMGLRISSPSSGALQPVERGTRALDLMAGFQDLKRMIRDIDGKLESIAFLIKLIRYS